VLTALAARVEDLSPAGTPVRHHNNTLRAWKSLPIRVSAGRATGRTPTSDR
jgi:hypothetical protein